MKNERLAIQFDLIGALVQLVRMPACHAGGHEFESRTHRRNLREVILGGFLFLSPLILSILHSSLFTFFLYVISLLRFRNNFDISLIICIFASIKGMFKILC